MPRPKKTLFAVLTITVGLACASTANASGAADHGRDPSTHQARPAGGAATAEDPNLAPYPKRDVVLSLKGGGTVTDEPVPIDITGEGDRPERINSVQEALKASPALDGGLRWDWKRNVLVVPLVGPVDGSSPVVEAVKSSVSAAAKGLTVEFQSVKYSRGELEELTDRLFSTMNQWAPGLTGAKGGWDPEANRVVVSVRNNSAHVAAWADRVKALSDSRVVFQSHPPKPSSGLQGRMTDFSPWAAGDWLQWANATNDPSPANNDCTGGWSWRKWTTNVYLGSTAYHCVWDGVVAHMTWYAAPDKIYGTAVRTHKGTDSALLGISECQCYAPLVWVGDSWTEDLRVVSAVNTSWYIGQAVALSAVNSGLSVAHVKSTSWPEDGFNSVAMYEEVSLGGDSGGPWLTTKGPSDPNAGDVVAHGQHLGVSDVAGTGSLFMRLNDISTKHEASILLWP